jgi:hypothetical protein
VQVIEKIELENVTVSLLSQNVIRIQVKERALLDVKDVKEIQAAKKKLIGDMKHTVLLVSPKYGSATREARDYSASPEVNLNAKAKAVVLNGLVMRIIINFFMNYNKPPVEHRVFENEKEALEWLRSLN